MPCWNARLGFFTRRLFGERRASLHPGRVEQHDQPIFPRVKQAKCTMVVRPNFRLAESRKFVAEEPRLPTGMRLFWA